MKHFIYTLICILLYFPAHSQIIISEIMYNPPEAGDDSLEYIELYNTSDAPYSLAGHFFTAGVVDTFDSEDIIPAKGYFIIAKDDESFKIVYGKDVEDWDDGSLKNGGEAITIAKPDGSILCSMVYGNAAAGWPAEADGGGYSLELCDITKDYTQKSNWGKSNTAINKEINGKALFGTPGKANSAECGPVYAATVEVTNDKFTPKTVTIKQGETILWKFTQGVHNVNDSQSTFPTNPNDFLSGDPKPAPYEFTYTFQNIGTNNYQCDPHAAMGMKGVVIVEPLNPGIDYPKRSIAAATQIDNDGKAVMVDSLAELSGTVYGGNVRPQGLQFVLIDGSNDGITVFSSNQNFGYNATETDNVIVKGKITQFNGLIELLVDSIKFVNTGNSLFAPTLTSALGEATESQLMRLDNVHIVDTAQWKQGQSFNVTLSDGTNEYTMRILSATTASSIPAPLGTFDVIGLGGQFDQSSPYLDGYQFSPRYKEDILIGGAVHNQQLANKINLFPNPAKSQLFINTDLNISQIKIYSINGQMLQESKVKNVINLNSLESGIYLIQFTCKEGLVTKKFVKL